MSLATYLTQFDVFTDEQRAEAVRKLSFTTVVDAARRYANQLKLVRVIKPVRAKGNGSHTSVSISRCDAITLVLTTKTGSEHDAVQCIKRAAELLRGFNRSGSFSKAVVVKAAYLAQAGWSMQLTGEERDACEHAAANNQAQDEALGVV